MKLQTGLRLAAAALLVAFGPGAAQAFELVTAAEAALDRQSQTKAYAAELEEIRPRSVPSRQVLAIRILAPSSSTSVPAPLRIELAFQAPPGARIVPATFRVLYGVLKLDLTERLRRFATVSESGVVVEQALMPDGVHRLFLQVSDDKGNLAEQELRLRVGVPS